MRCFTLAMFLFVTCLTRLSAGNAVWWEAENTSKNDFTTTKWFSEVAIPTKLSKEKWLTCHVKDGVATDKKEFTASYEIDIPADSEYTFWVREFYRLLASPWKFRFDDGEWKVSGKNHPIHDLIDLRDERSLVWCEYGKFKLTKGKHTLEIKVLPRGKNKGFRAAFDCFFLTDVPFKPNGWLKPQVLAQYGYIGTYAWLEGETASNDFTNKTGSIPESSKTLSNGEWLVCSLSPDSEMDNVFTAKWKFKLPLSGPYHIWMRELTKRNESPFEYRFNGSKQWKKASANLPAIDDISMNNKISVCWVNYKSAYLSEGENTLEIRLSRRNRLGAVELAIDCICVSLAPFHPQGKLKPDSKITAPPGYFAFMPNAALAIKNKKPVFDLSRLNEKTSGSRGFCVTDAKGMVFKDGTRPRFWGVDCAEPITASKATVDSYVAKLASLGVNLIRVNGSLCSRETGAFGECDKYLLDKLFYFVSVCKKNGVYVALANYSPADYTFAKDSAYDGYENPGTHPYGLLYISAKYRRKYKRWSRFLRKRNPYTRTRLCDDPTIVWFELQQNDTLFGENFNKIPPAQKKILDKKYDDWLLKRHSDRRSVLHAWNMPQKYHPVTDADGLRTNNPMFVLLPPSSFKKSVTISAATDFMNRRKFDQLLFLMELKRNVDDELISYLRRKCKFKGIIATGGSSTSAPRILGPIENLLNSEGGLIARTAYFEPDIQGRQRAYLEGTSFRDRTALRNPLSSPIVFPNFPGKTTVEIITGWPLPNKYRAEAVPLMAAYLSLRGAGAVLWYDNKSPYWVSRLRQDSVFCPAIAGAFPGYALMFRRGDVSKGATVATYRLSEKSLVRLAGAPLDYSDKMGRMSSADLKSPKGEVNPSACLVGNVDYKFGGKGAKSAVRARLISKNINKKKGYIKSSTGELTLNYKKGYLKINTPRSQAFVGFFPKRKPVHLKDATITVKNAYGSVLVISLDGKTIADSEHILLQFFSEERNSNWKVDVIKGDPYRKIKNAGDAPVLSKIMRGAVLLKGKNKEEWKAYKLNVNGFRAGELSFDQRSIHLKVNLPSDTFYIELEKKK
ncbi:MAG: hypothetical protein GXP32_01490 [Kiritimatiellaeota bacterium]|nr:hypothetical protein [Kiritimatiellota bacterium]